MSSSTLVFHKSKPLGELEPELKHVHFGEFFEEWLVEQEHDLEELTSAVKSHPESTQSLGKLVDRVISHYENYYRVKSESAKRNVLDMLTPAWLSHLEESFLWVGGWRPTMAFHLLYSKVGLQLEDKLTELASGLGKDGFEVLSPGQLVRVDELHRQTVKEEKELSEGLAAQQETLADSSMVKLSNQVTELTRCPDSVTRSDSVEKRVELTLASKERALEMILGQADDLRLRTLKDVVHILNPIQAVHFLIAAAMLHLRVHEWGKSKDDGPAHTKSTQGHSKG